MSSLNIQPVCLREEVIILIVGGGVSKSARKLSDDTSPSFALSTGLRRW